MPVNPKPSATVASPASVCSARNNTTATPSSADNTTEAPVPSARAIHGPVPVSTATAAVSAPTDISPSAPRFNTPARSHRIRPRLARRRGVTVCGMLTIHPITKPDMSPTATARCGTR